MRHQLVIPTFRFSDYLEATRHPWACLVFLLPLLAAYEGGIIFLGGNQPATLRNGADTWMRMAFETAGLPASVGPPLVLALFLMLWSFIRRDDWPGDMLSVWLGMVLESIAFALALWGVSRCLGSILAAQCPDPKPDEALARIVTFLGAGICEEFLFRLLAYAGLLGLLRVVGFPGLLAMVVAAVASAFIFAVAHHIGPHGEDLNDRVFLFRAVAGLFFVFLFQLRGFGIAVGAHAAYDILVGMGVG